jgi:ABC-type transport system involved in multi-copper enzyme maturation permease subunit
MKTILASLWKEWRQQRWFLLAGVVLFWLIPLGGVVIELYATTSMDRIAKEMLALQNTMTLSFGGLFAIILAVGVICSEFDRNLLLFWQSRPITLTQWLIIKYLFGLGILIISCILCFAVSIGTINIFIRLEYLQELATAMYHSFTLLLIYSTAFLIGTLVRQNVQAVILSVGAGLLIYFLPVIFPPLSDLSLFNIIAEGQMNWSRGPDHPAYVHFMILASAVMLIFALLSLHYDWRIKMGKPLMFWSLGGVFIILLASAGFQLNSNLTCEQQIVIPNVETGHTIYNVGTVMTGKTQGVLAGLEQKELHIKSFKSYLYRFDLSQPAFFLGQPIFLGPYYFNEKESQMFVLLGVADSPDRIYLLRMFYSRDENKKSKLNKLFLSTVMLDRTETKSARKELDLTSYFHHIDMTPQEYCIYKNSIYILRGTDLIQISLANPDQPEVVTVLNEPSFGIGEWIMFDNGKGYMTRGEKFISKDHPTIRTLAIPELNDRERLELTIKLMPIDSSERFALENDLLICHKDEQQKIGGNFELAFKTYRLECLEKDKATFTLVGQWSPTPLERLVFHDKYLREIKLDHGLAWMPGNHRGTIMVYDVRQPERPSWVGHFASHGEQFYTMTPLPDGRMLLGGKKMYIIAPPKR